PWRVTLLLSRLYTRVSEPLERHDNRRSRHDRHFSTNASAMASPGFCGPLGRPAPGVADTRLLPTQEAVKRNLQPTRPFPQPLPRRARPYQKSDAEPQRLSLGSRKARGLGLLHGRGHLMAALPWGRTLGHGTSKVGA